jgi:hypothetical protein
MTFTTVGFSQVATLSAIVNGKKTSEKIITETAGKLTVQRVKYKNVHSLTLVLNHHGSSVYKRSVEFTNESGTPVYHVQESKSKRGLFIINLSQARHIIAKERLLKLYLLEDPSNDLMALPSRRNLLIEIHFI